jgi:glycosyltransferase involved in cell wall biosynthesis
LNFEHYPKDLPGVHGRYYRKYFPRFAKIAARIATVSEYSKRDISELYDIDLATIDVVYNGVSSRFKPSTSDQIMAKRNELTGGADYFVFVGSLHPRKNIHRLFRAYEKFKTKTGSNIKLVIVGEKFWWNEEIKESFENITAQDDVIFCGRLNSEALVETVAAATAMTFVPYFEGFGIPILEAFSSQIPVITANVTSMPEVAGDAALLVNPFDVDEIAGAMERLAQDEELRRDLVAKGANRLTKFSWEQTADLLWKSIEKILPQH